MDPRSAPAPTLTWPVFGAIIASVCGFAFVAGLTYPAMSLALAARGVDAASIGFNGMMTGLGLLVSSPIVPRLVARFGSFPVLLVSGVLGTTALLLLTVFDSFFAWCLLRFLFAAMVDAFFVVGEASIAALAPPATRGRLVAIYSTALTVAFAAGPALLTVIGFEGPAPFVIAALVVVGATVASLPLRRNDPLRGEGEPGAGRLLPVMLMLAPLMLAVGATGFLDGALLALLPVYAMAQGVAESAAALPLTALLVGGICTQVPLGWLADRAGYRPVLLGCACVTTVMVALLSATHLASWPAYAVLVLLGGAAFGIYTVSLALIGQLFRGPALAAASAGFALTWGLGAALGPLASGAVMNTAGPLGLPVTLLLVFGGGTILLVAGRNRAEQATA